MASRPNKSGVGSDQVMSRHMQSLNVNELKDTFLECPVCTEHFNQTDRRPRLLHSCLHAFCTQCLQQLLDKEGRRQITCPLCLHVQPVRGKSDSLPVDPVRDHLTEFIQIKAKKVPCTDCPDGQNAESRCQDCLCYLCNHCDSAHRRNRLSRDHAIVALDDFLQDPKASFSRGHLCPIHPKHHLEFYCDTDEELCCVSCCIVDHKGHDMKKLEDAAASRVQNIESSLRTARQIAARTKEALKKGEIEIKEILNVKAQSVHDINSVFDNLKQEIDVHRAKLLSEVEAGSGRALTTVKAETAEREQTLAHIESTETYFRRSKEKADVVEMLQMYPSIMKSIENVKEEPEMADDWKECGKFKFVSDLPNTETCLQQFGRLAQIGADVRALEVKGIPVNMTDDTLMYFESRKRSGGGDVEALERSSTDTAIIYFLDDEALERVAARRHVIYGHTLTVSIIHR